MNSPSLDSKSDNLENNSIKKVKNSNFSITKIEYGIPSPKKKPIVSKPKPCSTLKNLIDEMKGIPTWAIRKKYIPKLKRVSKKKTNFKQLAKERARTKLAKRRRKFVLN